ncbi:MAG: hypothetical protein C4K49_09005 [Candidatus Thorarchaeota archaeon]|nr:MAG: hypothetical protein C4K49_09005 [Candidatus Thorarchaeota archaeon]
MLFVISVALLLTYWVVVSLYTGLSGPITFLYAWLEQVSVVMGYPGSFLISFIGNATILIPFPYIAVPFMLGGLTDTITHEFMFNPFVVGIASGIGATLGEMTGYAIGRAGGHFIDESRRGGFLSLIEKHPRLTPLVLWFLAVTPLPDDELIVPLGVVRYPWWKVFLLQLLGKSMFLTGVAWAGRTGLGFIQQLIDAINPTSWVSKSAEVLTVLAVVVILYLMVRVDWSNLKANRPPQEISPP